MAWLLHATLIMNQAEESIITKFWTLTSKQKLSNRYRFLYFSRMELLPKLHALSVLFLMKYLSFHGLEDMVQQSGQEDHLNVTHWTFYLLIHWK